MKNIHYTETDEDFDNFKLFGKKVDSFADVFRSKAKVECIDAKKDSGGSASSARKECRKELGGNIFTRGAKVIGLSVPRGAFLTLVRLNYRGLASRTYRSKLNEPRIYDEAVTKFVKLGGSKDAFIKAVEAGKSKKPLICGDKCKAKINFDGQTELSKDELLFFKEEPDSAYNNFDPATLAGTIASASAIMIPIINIIGKSKATQEELEANRQEAEIQKEMLDKQAELEKQKAEGETKLVKNLLIGGSVLFGVLITGAIVMKVVNKRKSKK